MRTGRNEPCPCKSGRKYKTCCLKEHSRPLAALEAVFAEMQQEQLQDTEPLTDAVIAELCGRGWPRADLVDAAADGARYCRSRHSLSYPLEMGLV